jgi:hypothetical protein
MLTVELAELAPLDAFALDELPPQALTRAAVASNIGSVRNSRRLPPVAAARLRMMARLMWR